jgi:hypothetical protein
LKDWQKNLLINNIADRKEPIDMTNYDDYDSFEEFDYAQKNPEKYAFFQENGITYDMYKNGDEDAKDAYNWAFEYPEKFTLSKAVTDDVVEYKRYTKALSEIRADKDSRGNSISGSAKRKKMAYIESLDIGYEQKLILHKSQYESDTSYNREIVEYLNGREDISFEQWKTILKELGFKVSEDGTVRW